jgi:hypothetical protein
MRIEGGEHPLDSTLYELLIFNIADIIALDDGEDIREDLELFEEIGTGALFRGDRGKLSACENERNTEEDAHTCEDLFTH